MRTLRPAGWAEPRGYVDGVEGRGRLVFVAGQIGWDPATQQLVGDDFLGQARQTLRNVLAVLAEAGAGAEHLVRMTWYVVDRDEYLAAARELGRAYRELLGRHYPPMSLVIVAGLLEPAARVEIEATALVPDPPGAA